MLVACIATQLVAPQPSPMPDVPTTTPVPTTEPSATPPATPTVFPTATPGDPEWDDPAPGVERRDIRVTEPSTGQSVPVHMVRLDPNLIDLKVIHDPGVANTVQGWQAETGALVVVNGGFFDAQLTEQGLTLVNGEAYGTRRDYTSDLGVGGLFAVKDGQPEIVALGRTPQSASAYDYDFATESYPMLLNSGGETAFNDETGHTARRTVVAMDEQGRVIFMLIREDAFSLYGLSRMLANLGETHDLPLDVALNLDGGTSSGMIVQAGVESMTWFSDTGLPIVITASRKEVG